MALLNEHADVVADDLAQRLVDHRHVRLAADVIAELGLDNRERDSRRNCESGEEILQPG